MNGNMIEYELRELFADGDVLASPEISGRICAGIVGAGYHVRAEFAVSDSEERRYDALRLIVTNEDSGFLHDFVIRLSDAFGLTESATPHLYETDGGAEWRPRRPSQWEWDRLIRAVNLYLDAFRKPGERQPKTVYICVPLRGDAEQNMETARKLALEAWADGNIPVCPRFLVPWRDTPPDREPDAATRAVILRLVESCDQVRTFGSPWSKETWLVVRHAKSHGIPVRNYDGLPPILDDDAGNVRKADI